jgi:copper chaperone
MLDLVITGMTCGGCVSSVRRAVDRVVPGAPCEIELETGALRLDGVDAELEPIRTRVREAIEAAGFGVEMPRS